MAGKSPTDWHIHTAGIAACAALSAGLWFMVVQPQLDQRAHAADLRADLSSRQQKLEELSATLSVDRAQLAALKDELGAKELRLDGMDKLNQRLAAISELATRSSLSMGKETPGAVTDEPHYKSLQIHYEGKGTYPNFAAFLHQLRTMFPDTSIASLEARGAGTGAGIEFNFELIWYTHK
ncbi:MAG TPA: type 4a pilus biogenesis protein PilO [Humisphaera sp.]|jgi:Tfp pilus assembly protein PilO|nr:type 4a pilus biogenesis protein PilO [Humisphaera sp.]